MQDQLNDNGGPISPVIQIAWDDEKKDCNIGVDFRVYKNFEFAIAVLKMAQEKLERAAKQQQIKQMQQQMAQQQADQALAQKLKHGGIVPGR